MLTHINDQGKAKMVDVGDKPVTRRKAVACGHISIQPLVSELIQSNALAKGDVLQVARCAGIMAAKRTDELIPLCHSLPVEHIQIDFQVEKECVKITATVETSGKTGVEMEALTAVSTAALTIYDMCKAVDKTMVMGPIYLQEKTGGKSGPFVRTEPPCQ